MNQDRIPDQYKPIGMWGYFGYQILFAIPVVGFIFLIVFSLSNQNINRRNFARSYFCVLVIALVIVIIALVTGGIGNLTETISQALKGVGN